MVLTYSRAYKTNAKTQRRRGKAELYAVRDVQLCNTQCTDEQGAMHNTQCRHAELLLRFTAHTLLVTGVYIG